MNGPVSALLDGPGERGYGRLRMDHFHRFRVIYGDTDAMGVVYYANYFRYFEAARTELLRDLGVPYRQLESDGFMLPVAEAHAHYHAPARYDDALVLQTTIERVRFSSIEIAYRITREDDASLVATGKTRHACIGPSGRVSRLPDALRGRLTQGANV